jgi:hypothetical protein
VITSMLKSQAPHVVAWLVVLLFVLAGCTGAVGSPRASEPSGDPAPGAPSPVPPTEAPTDAATGAPAALASAPPSREPPSVDDGDEPPEARLLGTGAGPVAGALGTFSWDGLVSDSPWIVPRRGVEATAGATLRVRFEPGPGQVSWTARWARIRDGQAGRPRGAGSGDAGPIAVEAPSDAGDWSLQVEARFAGGGRAVWYWRVVVGGG